MSRHRSRTIAIFALLAGVSTLAWSKPMTGLGTLSDYDVVWDSPSKDAAGSMPIGNGELVLNTWVEEATGDLMILFGRTDTLSEISRILKIGRLRIHIGNGIWAKKGFRQRLNLKQGKIEFKGEGHSLELIVDSEQDVFHLKGTSQLGTPVVVTAENWRNKPRVLEPWENVSAWSMKDAPFPLVESADRFFQPTDKSRLVWFHRNLTSAVPTLLKLQSLQNLAGTFDPLLDRTFGALVSAPGFERVDTNRLITPQPMKFFAVSVATATTQQPNKWEGLVESELSQSPVTVAFSRTARWWERYWNRSHVFVQEKSAGIEAPANDFPLRKGMDSGGGNRFRGTLEHWIALDRAFSSSELKSLEALPDQPANRPFTAKSFTLSAVITPQANDQGRLEPGRIFDKLTAGQNNGFLFDTHPGNALRFIVGNLEISAPNVLKPGETAHVVAVFDAAKGNAAIYKNGEKVAGFESPTGSAITRGYVLQRYVQACQSRGEYPVKFNGGYYCVEPTAMGIDSNPDFRRWGDAHWFQNVRHMYHPMLASGDVEMTEAFFRLYEKALPLAKARAADYHGVKGAYFPETMTVFGTYAGGDYGWDRTGLKPNQVQCPWWDDAWNQGPELVNLMLDRWDYAQDLSFLKGRTLPMAKEMLLYFDTRFQRDANGKLLVDPTQVVETYWEGVVNDSPVVAGLHRILERLNALQRHLDPELKAIVDRLTKALPPIPVEVRAGEKQLAPAEKYSPKTFNVENGELYPVWPFGAVSLLKPQLIDEAKVAYKNRKNRLDNGWGYDGNVAATLGMSEEAGRILAGKVRNSHPAYRWPATWGPNFDWLPDQNHGGNILNQTQLMLLQSEPMELGGRILLLPAWPKRWDVSFKLHAPGKTVVECEYRDGKIQTLKVSPESRRKDVVLPAGW